MKILWVWKRTFLQNDILVTNSNDVLSNYRVRVEMIRSDMLNVESSL